MEFLIVNNTSGNLVVGGGSTPFSPAFGPPNAATTDDQVTLLSARVPGDIQITKHTPSPVTLTTITQDGELVSLELVDDPPRPCYRSVWQIFGLRRRPKRLK